jgi:hypothetical protein
MYPYAAPLATLPVICDVTEGRPSLAAYFSRWHAANYRLYLLFMVEIIVKILKHYSAILSIIKMKILHIFKE